MNMVHPPQTSSMKRWEDAPTRSVDVAGARFVYRQLGPATGVPVIMLNHWGAVLDNFDPRIVDGLAATRPVIALDYRGVGASTGKAPLTVAEMAEDAIAFIRALGFEEVDLLGFSLGGFVAQEMVLSEPDLIRKVILTGTGPAAGAGIEKVGAVSFKTAFSGSPSNHQLSWWFLIFGSRNVSIPLMMSGQDTAPTFSMPAPAAGPVHSQGYLANEVGLLSSISFATKPPREKPSRRQLRRAVALRETFWAD